MSDSIRRKLHLESRKVLHHERGEVPIFSQGEKVLFVQSVDIGLGILVDDNRGDDDRSTFVGSTDAVDGETSGKTGDRSEERLECFCEVMGDEVLVYLMYISVGPSTDGNSSPVSL
jgi:hypothetical protein